MIACVVYDALRYVLSVVLVAGADHVFDDVLTENDSLLRRVVSVTFTVCYVSCLLHALTLTSNAKSID